MKKNDTTVQTADKQLDDEKLKKREAKKAALKAKKQKEAEKKAAAKAKREAKKAKKAAKLQKLKEKKAAKKAAAKVKRDAKKAKKLARLQKLKEKKAALKAKKQAARQKKLAREAKKRAKIKEQKQKAREKAKLQKQKLEAKQKKTETKAKPEAVKPEKTEVSINDTVKALKAYIRSLAKDGVDEKKAKKLKWLGFTFDDETVAFQYSAKLKGKKAPKKVEPAVEVIEPEVVEPASDIDAAVAEVMDGNSEAVEALAAELEADNEDKPTEVPIGDTFTDNVTYDKPDDDELDEDVDEDDTIEDFRDEDDPDKVDFRRDWNNEFDDDGERNEDW